MNQLGFLLRTSIAIIKRNPVHALRKFLSVFNRPESFNFASLFFSNPTNVTL